MAIKRNSGPGKPRKKAANYSEKPLQSWKEIAAYLERTERTARRWEKEAGLPVRRHHKGPRSTVYAYRSELDTWRAGRMPKAEQTRVWRWALPGALSLLGVLLAALFVEYSPILNPPNPLVEAAEGVTIRQVWTGVGTRNVFRQPSSDGRYLAFSDPETGDLALRDLFAEQEFRVTNKGTREESQEQVLESIFSPDDRQVACTWQREGGAGVELRLMGLDNSNTRTLFVPEFGEYVLPGDWSQDGKHILANLIQEETNEIVLISVADGSVRTLKTIDSGMRSLDRRLPATMSLSPDGRYVVYDLPPGKDYGNRDIFALSTKTGREVQLIEHEANDLFPLWAPDGKYVVFASNRRGNFGLWILPVEDGEAQGWPQLVKADIGQHFVSLGFTSDGVLYYRLSPGTRDAYLAGIDLSEGRVVGEPTVISQRFLGFNSKPEWSVDGQFLSYVSIQHMLWHGGRRSYSRIVMRELDTGEERDVSFPISFISRTSWSPDRRFFLVRGRAPSYSYGVFKVDASTGDMTVVVKRDRKTRSWASQVSWSRDGKSMYYSLTEGYREKRQQSLRVRDLETGQETELLRAVWPDEFDGLGLSRDGEHLAYVWGNRDTGIRAIHIMPSLGGQSLEIFRVEKPELLVSPRSLEWTPDDREILFVRDVSSETEKEPFELMAISTQGGVARSLGQLMEGVLDLTLSPDGNQIAFTAGRIGSEVWAIEGFLPED